MFGVGNPNRATGVKIWDHKAMPLFFCAGEWREIQNVQKESETTNNENTAPAIQASLVDREAAVQDSWISH